MVARKRSHQWKSLKLQAMSPPQRAAMHTGDPWLKWTALLASAGQGLSRFEVVTPGWP